MNTNPNFSDLHGLANEARNAIQHAITRGDRGLVLLGAPGIGKTMIARRAPSLFEPPTDHESRWIAATYEGEGPAAGYWPTRSAQNPRQAYVLPGGRPFRAPHHSCGGPALVSEARLARCGVLYLDDLQDFSTTAIRELSRALPGISAAFAPFILASALPCPCGFFGYPEIRECACPESLRAAYDQRILQGAVMLGIQKAPVTIPEFTISGLRAAYQGPHNVQS
jgi:magnesium chelatase family protein